jgi:hypothetical protein
MKASGLANSTGFEAQIERDITISPQSADLRFAMELTNTYRVFADVGCTLKIRNEAGDFNRFLFVISDGTLKVVTVLKRGGMETEVFSEDLIVGFPSGWYAARIVMQLEGSDALLVTLTATAPTAAVKTATYKTTPPPGGTSLVEVNCGIDFATSSTTAPIPLVVRVDDVSLDLCPR